MRAAVFTDYKEALEIREVERPTLDSGGIIVETEACGICRSDWHAWANDVSYEFEKGHILGHEPAGYVTEVGEDVEHIREGDHVAIPFNLNDGTCHMCRNGHANLCDNRMAVGFSEGAQGAWAEELHVPMADFNTISLPTGVTSVDMAGLGCRFMTSFHALAHKADISAGDWVAIHGCGGIGLSAVHIADALGASVVAVDLFDNKLDFAMELGARATVNASEVEDVPSEVRDITDGGANVAVDALGIATTCQNSVLSLDKLGQHVQIGLTTSDEAGEIPLPTDYIVRKEIEFIGSRGMQPARYDEIFSMLEAGKIDPAQVITETVPLDRITDVLQSMTDYENVGISVVDQF
jgi:alcohol dehydrogenase